MAELRPYQEDLLRKAEKALAAPDARVMLQLPTGGGKTRIAAALLAGWVRRGGKAAWLTHRRELSDQTRNELNKSGVYATNTLEWESYDLAPAKSGGVVVLMAQTVSRRNKQFDGLWDEYDSEDLLIIDEAHHATAPGWERAICQWRGRVIGLTATPWRLEKSLGFDHLFHHPLIPGPQISELQAKGYLAAAEVATPAPDELMYVGGLDSKGEFIEREIELANQGRLIWTRGALEFWQTHAKGRQTIIYAVSVRHAENLATVFNKAGVRAGVILGSKDQRPEERDRNVNRFRNGELKVLVNVAVATEGFDVPNASCVVLACPTMSLALYLQMVGRGLRRKPDGGDCLILDLAGNVKRHNLPNYEHRWSLEPYGELGEGDAPIVRCPECERVSPASSHNCQYCGNPFGKTCHPNGCGQWRAWKWWITKDYCRDDHELVCDRCHPDAHTNLPLSEELKEVMKKVLNENLTEVNPSSLRTLEDVQDRICELAENLVNAKKIGDVATLNHMTEQLKPLLKRDTQLKRAKLSEATPKLKADLNEVFHKLGDEVTHLHMEYHDEKGVRVTYRLNGGNETVGNWLPWWDSMRPYIQD